MIFNIQKCSIHDGNGLRTIVFFKGCPLRCEWCANPESQLYTQEIMERPIKCIHCGACLKTCPSSAISIDDKQFVIDRNKCIKCFKCTEICYAESKEIVGKEMTAEEIFKEVYKDRLYYQQYGGGVTFSGGEPLTQPELLTELAMKCKKYRINTTIETCGYGDFDQFKKALPYIDSMFFDIKHIDPVIHKELTGYDNKLILDNLKKISDYHIPITVRTPVVPGCNDSIECITAIASLIKDIPAVRDYELLPYHNLGSPKYTSLGREYQLEEIAAPSEEQIIQLVKLSNQILQPSGKQCYYTKKNKKEIKLL